MYFGEKNTIQHKIIIKSFLKDPEITFDRDFDLHWTVAGEKDLLKPIFFYVNYIIELI